MLHASPAIGEGNSEYQHLLMEDVACVVQPGNTVMHHY